MNKMTAKDDFEILKINGATIFNLPRSRRNSFGEFLYLIIYTPAYLLIGFFSLFFVYQKISETSYSLDWWLLLINISIAVWFFYTIYCIWRIYLKGYPYILLDDVKQELHFYYKFQFYKSPLIKVDYKDVKYKFKFSNKTIYHATRPMMYGFGWSSGFINIHKRKTEGLSTGFSMSKSKQRELYDLVCQHVQEVLTDEKV